MTLSADELIEMMDYDPKLLLVDVRTTEEYDAGHIAGSGHMPIEVITDCLYDEALAEAGLDDIAHSKGLEMSDDASAIVFCCSHGVRAQEAVQHFEALGYENVYAAEGLIEWPYDLVTTASERTVRAADAAIADDIHGDDSACSCSHCS